MKNKNINYVTHINKSDKFLVAVKQMILGIMGFSQLGLAGFMFYKAYLFAFTKIDPELQEVWKAINNSASEMVICSIVIGIAATIGGIINLHRADCVTDVVSPRVAKLGCLLIVVTFILVGWQPTSAQTRIALTSTASNNGVEVTCNAGSSTTASCTAYTSEQNKISVLSEVGYKRLTTWTYFEKGEQGKTFLNAAEYQVNQKLYVSGGYDSVSRTVIYGLRISF